MKILIISDLHLGRFSKRKYEFFKKIIEEHDRVIINGDFYEGYIYNFEQFIVSRWKALFPLLKSKNTTYVFGNHDNQNWIQKEYANSLHLFSNAQHDEYTFNLGGKTYNIQHGHLLSPFLDTKLNFKPPKLAARMGIALDTWLGNVFGRSIYYAYARLLNRKIKFVINQKSASIIYIVGHTHWGEVDIENRFINSGVNKHNYAQYITLTEQTVTLTTVPRFKDKRYIKSYSFNQNNSEDYYTVRV
jgi:predicted phosphodiesterase